MEKSGELPLALIFFCSMFTANDLEIASYLWTITWSSIVTFQPIVNKHPRGRYDQLYVSFSFIFSSDRCSITYPWLVLVLVLLFFLCRLHFSQELLGIIHCSFADMFSILLLNDSQSLNTFEILVWDIFAFFTKGRFQMRIKSRRHIVDKI